MSSRISATSSASGSGASPAQSRRWPVAHRGHPLQMRLLNDPDLLLRCPPPPVPNTGEHLAAIVTPGRALSHMHHSYSRAGPGHVV
jgi:hypothetical protein